MFILTSKIFCQGGKGGHWERDWSPHTVCKYYTLTQQQELLMLSKGVVVVVTVFTGLFWIRWWTGSKKKDEMMRCGLTAALLKHTA